MKAHFYVIKFGLDSYWIHNSGDTKLVRGSVGTPLLATRITKAYAKSILPKIKGIIKSAELVEVKVEYTEEITRA